MTWDLIASWWMHRRGKLKASWGRLLGLGILTLEGERDQFEAQLRSSIARRTTARAPASVTGEV